MAVLRVFILAHAGARQRAAEFLRRVADGVVVTFKEANRTSDQNAVQWPILEAFAEQLQWPVNGSMVHMTSEEWKDVLSATFSGEILSAKPATHADQLWWGDDANGVPRIFTQAEKRQGRTPQGGTTQWGLTLRETIEKALDSEARGAAHWLEFQRDYLRPPANLVPPEDPRRVRGVDQPKVSFVVGTTAYTAYVGRHKSEHWGSQGLGFGGAEFVVKLEDGREFFTDNNWSRGEVPPHLRKLLRPNAVFLRGEVAARIPAAAAA